MQKLSVRYSRIELVASGLTRQDTYAITPGTAANALQAHPSNTLVGFVLFSAADLTTYEQALGGLKA